MIKTHTSSLLIINFCSMNIYIFIYIQYISVGTYISLLLNLIQFNSFIVIIQLRTMKFEKSAFLPVLRSIKTKRAVNKTINNNNKVFR